MLGKGSGGRVPSLHGDPWLCLSLSPQATSSWPPAPAFPPWERAPGSSWGSCSYAVVHDESSIKQRNLFKTQMAFLPGPNCSMGLRALRSGPCLPPWSAAPAAPASLGGPATWLLALFWRMMALSLSELPSTHSLFTCLLSLCLSQELLEASNNTCLVPYTAYGGAPSWLQVDFHRLTPQRPSRSVLE